MKLADVRYEAVVEVADGSPQLCLVSTTDLPKSLRMRFGNNWWIYAVRNGVQVLSVARQTR